MPLGGKKKKKGKKKPQDTKRKLRFCDTNERYAQVKTLFGDRRVEVYIPNEGLRKAHIPGRFRKRIWINKDDWVLVQYRDCDGREGGFCDIVYVYKMEEVRKLERTGEIEQDKSEERSEDMFDNFDDLEEYEEVKPKQDIEYPSSFSSSVIEEEEEEEEDNL